MSNILSIIAIIVSVVSVYKAQENNRKSTERDKRKESILAVNIFLNFVRDYNCKISKASDYKQVSKYSFSLITAINRWSLLYVNSELVDGKLVEKALHKKLKEFNNDFMPTIKYYRQHDMNYMNSYIEMLRHFKYTINERRNR